MNIVVRTFGIFIAAATLASTAFSESPSAIVDLRVPPALDFKVKSTEIQGAATFDGTKIRAENIRVNLKNLETGKELRDKHTKKHLEVEKFPEAILVKAQGEGGKGSGIIKIRGIEKPITGTFELIESNKFLRAKFKLLLSDFGITDVSFMGAGVQDEAALTVVVPVLAGKAPPAQAVSAGAKPAPSAPAKKSDPVKKK